MLEFVWDLVFGIWDFPLVRRRCRAAPLSRPAPFIPKGLNNTAQGCEARATLGMRTTHPINPVGVEAMAWVVWATSDATLVGVGNFLGE